MDQRGQVVPLLAIVVVAVGGLVLGLARFGAATAQSARAQAAADAAALAGAAESEDVAVAVAAANGAEVMTYDPRSGGEVEVRTRVGEVWAVARARRTGGGGEVAGWVGSSTSAGEGARLHPAVRSALESAAALLRQPVPIVAGSGRAVDVPRTFAARLATVASRVGLCRLTPSSDPVRFVACPSSRG